MIDGRASRPASDLRPVLTRRPRDSRYPLACCAGPGSGTRKTSSMRQARIRSMERLMRTRSGRYSVACRAASAVGLGVGSAILRSRLRSV